MKVKDVIQKEKKYARHEYQLKIKADKIRENDILKLGAQKLGSLVHEDTYFIPSDKSVDETKELIRVRKVGGEELLFTYKGPVVNLGSGKIVKRLVIDREIREKHIAEIKSEYKEVVTVNKKRTIFLLDKS